MLRRMSLPSHARVVIIGGGAVGVSALYHLARAGWTDCVLLEKNELTAGSTWHAAGNCPSFSSSWSLMNMQRYSLALYRQLGALADYPINYNVTGSIRLAHSPERMQEFARAVGMGQRQGMGLELIGPDEIRARYPFIETHDLKGALHDPADGDIDPAQLTQALAKAARAMGAQIHRFTPATGISRRGDDWIVHTGQGDIACETVVNAAGYYAARVGAWFRPFGGHPVPMVAMSHQYLMTDPIPEVEAWTAEVGHKLPLLRDVDTSYYLRQEKAGFNLGPYERDCRAHWVTQDDPMPEDFSFQLFPDALDRLEPYVADAMARVPLLASAGIRKVVNGPIPYAPDGLPLLGPMPGVRNAFQACVFTFGITQAGGAGKVLAEWVTEGAPEWDMWSCDPRRFTGWVDPDYTHAKAVETYGHEYAMHFPWHSWPAGRDRRLSPVHDRVKALGGVMGAYNGWERANWYAQPGDDTSEAATQTWGRAGPWEPRIAEECAAVRDGVGVLDLPGFSRFRLKGPGAAAWLDSLCTGRLPAVGRVGLLYFADARGRLVTEMSAMRIDDDFFFLITAAVAEWHDLEWLQAALPANAPLELTNVTEAFACQIVTGPASRALLARLSDADLTQPWLTHQSCRINGAWVQLARVSFAGELGWEIHSKVADTPAIYDAVIAAGAKPFGMWALNSLRIEKGYRAWKGDLSTDYSVLDLGLERFVRWDKDFPGKAALAAEKQRGVARRFVTLRVDAADADAPYMSNIRAGGEIVGETTSGAWGYRVGASLALGMVPPTLAAPGTRVEVEIFGDRRPAEVLGERAAWDPDNLRLKA
jgi:dimethylglycine dehydrogenase